MTDCAPLKDGSQYANSLMAMAFFPSFFLLSGFGIVAFLRSRPHTIGDISGVGCMPSPALSRG